MRPAWKRGRRVRTCSRARCAAWRTVASDRSTASAISPWLKPNASFSTNTARSNGVSDSSTTSNAIDTDSAVTALSSVPSVATVAVRIGAVHSHFIEALTEPQLAALTEACKALARHLIER